MLKNLITILFILFNVSAFSQDLQLNISHKKLKDFINWEQSAGSKEFKENSRLFHGVGIAQPLVYRQQEKNLPDRLIYCFYYTKDSTINSLSYVWSIIKFEASSQNQIKLSASEINAFIEKYKQVYNQIMQQYGVGVSTGSLDDILKMNLDTFEKKDKWKTRDSSNISLDITLFNKFEQRGNTTTFPSCKIELDIENSAYETTGIINLDSTTVNHANIVFQSFLACLKAKRYDDARKLLSIAYVNSVTDLQLAALFQNINHADKLPMFISGTETLSGSKYLMLVYKYKTDTGNPIKKLVKVDFYSDKKILIVQPMKAF